ncbi:MAG: hypothetical protein AAB573_01645 [Patescibacteria group bacterium]
MPEKVQKSFLSGKMEGGSYFFAINLLPMTSPEVLQAMLDG